MSKQSQTSSSFLGGLIRRVKRVVGRLTGRPEPKSGRKRGRSSRDFR